MTETPVAVLMDGTQIVMTLSANAGVARDIKNKTKSNIVIFMGIASLFI